jgi:hypothetical protein
MCRPSCLPVEGLLLLTGSACFGELVEWSGSMATAATSTAKREGIRQRADERTEALALAGRSVLLPRSGS